MIIAKEIFDVILVFSFSAKGSEMEKYIKKYFWTINLIAIAACSYYAAKTTNTFTGAWLGGEEDIAKPAVATSNKTGDEQEEESEKAKFNPFDHTELSPPKAIEIEQVNKGTEPPPENTDNPAEFTENTNCPETKLQGTLVGTMASSDPLASFAMIENKDKEIKTYEIGDTYTDGAIIVQVIRHRVFLKNGDHIECFYHGDKPEEKKEEKPTTVTDSGEDIRKVSETEYIISSSFIQNAMANLNALATEARIVPSFKNGVGNGFRIYSIKPGSFYQKVGIKNGDVIQRVNDMDLDSPEKALTIYTKLKTERNLTLDLLRRGSKVSIDFTVQ